MAQSNEVIRHQDLTGEDLHGSRIEEVSGTPIGNITAPEGISGYLVKDTSTGLIYISVGPTKNDWELIKASADIENIVYTYPGIPSITSVGAALTYLINTNPIQHKAFGVDISSGISFALSQASYRGAEWDISLKQVSGSNFYRSKITAIHDSATGVDFNNSPVLVLPASGIADLIIDVDADGTNMKLHISGTAVVDYTIYEKRI